MPNTTTVDGDLVVRGAGRFNTLYLPPDIVGDDEMDPVRPVDVDKLKHQYLVGHNQVHGSAATTERRTVFIARSAGELAEVRATVSVACIGAAVIAIDVLKNGTTIMSADLEIDSGNAAYDVVVGTLTSSPTTYADEDVFEIDITATAGGGTLGQGLNVQLVMQEGHD